MNYDIKKEVYETARQTLTSSQAADLVLEIKQREKEDECIQHAIIHAIGVERVVRALDETISFEVSHTIDDEVYRVVKMVNSYGSIKHEFPYFVKRENNKLVRVEQPRWADLVNKQLETLHKHAKGI